MQASLDRIRRCERRHPRLAARLYAALIARSDGAGNRTLVLDALHRRHVCLEMVGEAAVLLPELLQALTEAEEQGLAWQAASLLEAIGRIRYTDGEYREAAQYWARCIELAQLCGNHHAGVEARIGLGQVYDAMGDGATAERLHRDASKLADELADPYLISKVAINQGFNLKMIGELDAARRQFERGIDAARAAGVRHYEAEAHWHLGALALSQAAFDEAEQHTRIALKQAQAAGYDWLLGGAYRTLADLLRVRGALAEATEGYEQALAVATRTGSRRQQADCHEWLARLAELRGDLAQALMHTRYSQSLQGELIRQLVVAERLDELRQFDLSDKPPIEALLALSGDPCLQGEDGERALQRICETGTQVLNASLALLWLCQPTGQLRLAANHAAALETRSAEPTESAVALAVLQEVRVVHDVRLHPQPAILSALCLGQLPRSALEVPLRQHGELVGMFVIVRQDKVASWSRDEVLFASHLGALVEHVLAHNEYRRMLAELAAANEQLEARVRERTRDLEAANRTLEEASLTDALTGLHNRRFFLQHIETDVAQALRRHQADVRGQATQAGDVVFYLADIDYFKRVNDQFGHAAGDQVLREVANRLRHAVRGSDYVVRWGGEEFMVVSRDAGRDRAHHLAERICNAMAEQPILLEDGRLLPVTMSIGYACFPMVRGDGNPLAWAQVVELADQALYLVKQGGRRGWLGALALGGGPSAVELNLAALLHSGELAYKTSLSETALAQGSAQALADH
ncbi:diguanylate cyclase [Chitinimonas sp. BJYL2]|uniref:diguanylate cyclase n=1 Tax=Chitinimonas sp. BJYL2 TaxID=2976696 RepID=UPI0022B51AD2|nr:diguanylate cyclase [Chitinimonas sp. BJYL2]